MEIIAAIVAFALTALIGNRLVQSWQERHWLSQQRFSGEEKEYIALKELAEEISNLMGIRIYRMQRLVLMLPHPPSKILQEAQDQYVDSVTQWNERLTSFYVRLRYHKSSYIAAQLEREIQDEMRSCGSQVMRLTKLRLTGASVVPKEITAVVDGVQRIQVSALQFNNELLDVVEKRKSRIYFGQEIPFTSNTLHHFSTWQLVKALFVHDIKSLTITRSTFDN